MTDKWVDRFFGLAEHISTWSKDPSTKVGAVAVSDSNMILSSGWNGLPRGIQDTDFRLNNRDIKYKLVVHAEQNCIFNATRNGMSLNGADLYVYGLPICSECAKGVIQVGIKRVFMCYPVNISDKWIASLDITRDMFIEAGVMMHERVY